MAVAMLYLRRLRFFGTVQTRETADLVTFTKEILNGKLYFFCAVCRVMFNVFMITCSCSDEKLQPNLTHFQGNVPFAYPLKTQNIFLILSRW